MNEYLKMDYQSLLNHLVGAGPTSQQHEMAKAVLQIRNMEAQSEAAKGLVNATKSLAGFTLALVWVTVVLVLVTAAELLTSWFHRGSP